MKKPIPKFKSLEEEEKFWDEFDINEYFDESDIQKASFPNLKKSKKLISIRLSEELLDGVKDDASKLSVPYQQLISQYIEVGRALYNKDNSK